MVGVFSCESNSNIVFPGKSSKESIEVIGDPSPPPDPRDKATHIKRLGESDNKKTKKGSRNIPAILTARLIDFGESLGNLSMDDVFNQDPKTYLKIVTAEVRNCETLTEARAVVRHRFKPKGLPLPLEVQFSLYRLAATSTYEQIHDERLVIQDVYEHYDVVKESASKIKVMALYMQALVTGWRS